jgi:uncharacterized protein (TIGR03435 family)
MGIGGRGTTPQQDLGCPNGTIRIDPSRISIGAITVNSLIMMAYSEWADERGGCIAVTAANYLSGVPEWVRSDFWDIEATIPAGAGDTVAPIPPDARGPAARGFRTPREVGPKTRAMLRRMLADRFNLVLRPQTKEMPVYLLTVGKNGFKSNGNPDWTTINGKPLNLNGVPVIQQKTSLKRIISEADGKRYVSSGMWKMSMPEIAIALMPDTKRPTFDRTNLSGTFDFHIDYDNDGGGARPTIFKAIEEVGLKLESARAPVEVWVIERVEKPSEN